MGGIFGKNKRSCLFPRVVYRAKGRKAARVCCDAATWTGERHFHSARIGRTPRGFEPPAAKLVLEASGSESGGEEGFSAASPRARHSEVSAPAAAGDTRGAELSQQPEAKPHPELLKHQGLTGEAPRSQNPQESGEAGAALSPPGSSLPPELQRGVTPLTWTTVEVDVHVSADGHEEPGRGQAAAKPELLSGAGREDGAGSGAGREDGAGSGAGREDGAGSGVKGAAGEPEQAEEMAEAAGDGQTSEEIPACLPETQGEEEEIQASSEGKPEEH
ncbi:protein bric-a-brac 2-like [Hirundo rustica]|uniref:protein bric-a-brac 2-like n=1 Tax=Hirundo rustica TaxID=43150 RepID=UPI001A93ADB2|nr:protein bric-a-brac 2-like [Hirundo rustica]